MDGLSLLYDCRILHPLELRAPSITFSTPHFALIPRDIVGLREDKRDQKYIYGLTLMTDCPWNVVTRVSIWWVGLAVKHMWLKIDRNRILPCRGTRRELCFLPLERITAAIETLLADVTRVCCDPTALMVSSRILYFFQAAQRIYTMRTPRDGVKSWLSGAELLPEVTPSQFPRCCCFQRGIRLDGRVGVEGIMSVGLFVEICQRSLAVVQFVEFFIGQDILALDLFVVSVREGRMSPAATELPSSQLVAYRNTTLLRTVTTGGQHQSPDTRLRHK
uniref:Uncharacterized protein n=1 Tax=Timema douglasi TaxID=61478 RepID=A0A7R8V8V7_TIMDO|nr:unnamed protein product [Timema douglasi]